MLRLMPLSCKCWKAMPLAFVAFAALCGCGKPGADAGSQWMTSFGTNHDPVTGWTVAVTESNGIRIGPRTNGFIVQFGSTISLPKWNAHPGWFVFAENPEKVWMFDGVSDVSLLLSQDNKVSVSGDAHKRHPVPTGVVARLPEFLRNQIPDKARPN